ncbi:family 20 glycosylhydrolase [Carnobacterium divergens]|uniref:family 20 glycosylhydrolase n=1 Tax=Carnobacterium divergens TaxID=2748 RepID=UPI00289289AF|nr:family 20 glycosylhydrolase [Carnobacterium divergens]MDT2010952.1 family 20 glycosylhydrolase [Carnobacterium divergens]
MEKSKNKLYGQSKQQDTHVSNKKKIISIDAGRKYISKAELKKIINQANLLGYTGMELIVGNNGLRFLLEDMTVTINEKVYKSDEVRKALLKGNRHYYDDPNGNALTQAEMDELLQFASEKKIEIIPVINSPGHMDTIIAIMKELKILNPAFKSSKSTIDLDNDLAVAFTKAIVKNYVAYFSTYAEIINFGCDEYANDVVEDGGWVAIQKQGTYQKFIAYANELALMAKTYKMKPMIFNDGIYYNNDDTFGRFDKDFIIAYWTSGWENYDVAMPEYLVEKGHPILNTNDEWYWVIGRKTIADGYYNFNQAVEGITHLEASMVKGAKGPLATIGNMQGIWSDEPNQPLDLSDLFKLMHLYSDKYLKE